jgi:uncharacterized protein
MRVFLDANILFSAAKSDGAIRRLLDLLIASRHECWADDYVVFEARRNLAAKYPHAVNVLETLPAQVRISPAQAPGPDQKLVNWLPEKDRPVLAAAMRLGCDSLVTGDQKHFGAAYGKVIGGVAIHTPRSLVQEILKRH